jgi:cation diffusion facilitator CzcD-associated flavoprotein CzcO
LEKASRLGGTWRENTYPGSACDVESMAYCFSFEQKTDWKRRWSRQPEILRYMEHCAAKYGLEPHLRFNSEVKVARFDEERGVWKLTLQGGEEIEADFFASGVGQLNRPYTPKLRGLDSFQGEVFHSARWNHGYNLRKKRVAVIGNAASAIQFIPRIARKVERLFVLQRSPNWMLPRGDRKFTDAERERFRRFPLLAKLYRLLVWTAHESWFPLFRRNRMAASIWAGQARNHLFRTVSDPGLRHRLTPNYPIGAKRVLVSDDYYRTLGRKNVDLVTAGLDHLEKDRIVLKDGHEHVVDAVILATGFRSTEFLVPMKVYGRGGVSINQDWKQGARAYYGITTSGYPNFFMMYGPNTNLGHNSIIFMIECQVGYIIDCIQKSAKAGLRYIDLRQEVMDEFNEKLDKELGRTAWAAVKNSWYKRAGGRITNNWSGTTTKYWWHTRRANLDDYDRVL